MRGATLECWRKDRSTQQERVHPAVHGVSQWSPPPPPNNNLDVASTRPSFHGARPLLHIQPFPCAYCSGGHNFPCSLHSLTASAYYIRSLHPLTTSAHCIRSLHPLTASAHSIRSLYPLTISAHYIRSLYPLTASAHYRYSMCATCCDHPLCLAAAPMRCVLATQSVRTLLLPTLPTCSYCAEVALHVTMRLVVTLLVVRRSAVIAPCLQARLSVRS